MEVTIVGETARRHYISQMFYLCIWLTYFLGRDRRIYVYIRLTFTSSESERHIYTPALYLGPTMQRSEA